MQSRNFALCLAVFSLTLAPLASAKEHKRADRTKVVKECTDKGGTWDKKKKKCTPAQKTNSSTDVNSTEKPVESDEAQPGAVDPE